MYELTYQQVLVLILTLIEVSMDDCIGMEGRERLFYFMDTLQTGFVGILGVLKIIWFRIYANNLINNYKSAIDDYLTTENVEERIVMRKHARAARFVTLPLMCLCQILVAWHTLKALSMSNNDEKYQNMTEDILLEYPVASTCTMKYFNVPISMYKINVVIQAIALIVMVNANFGSDALFINITLHVCGQIKLLRARLAILNISCPHINDIFNKLIQRHINLIQLARKLADTISFILLVELLNISVVICILGFDFILMMKDNDTAMMTQAIFKITAFLTKLSMYSYVGNYLKIQMENIGYSIYQSGWYELPIKMTRNVVFILMQTEAPVTLQAGHFIEVNLSTLVNILKTSFSYLSVLRIMLDT